MLGVVPLALAGAAFGKTWPCSPETSRSPNDAGNDPVALCPQLKKAMAKGIAVVSFDSDVNCRQLFINQANTETIGRSQMALMAKEMGYKGEYAILSAASTAANQNAWIRYMQLEAKLPKYKNMKLVKIYYGDDNPAKSLTATQSMIQAYPNLKGIISPTTVGISTAAQYLSTSKYKGKIKLIGLGLPSQMKKYVLDGTVKEFALWNPEDLGYLAAYAASSIASRLRRRGRSRRRHPWRHTALRVCLLGRDRRPHARRHRHRRPGRDFDRLLLVDSRHVAHRHDDDGRAVVPEVK